MSRKITKVQLIYSCNLDGIINEINKHIRENPLYLIDVNIIFDTHGFTGNAILYWS